MRPYALPVHEQLRFASLMSTIEITTSVGSATPAEAAAIAAAIQRFEGDTAVAPPAEDSRMDPWLRAALVEGVSAKTGFGRQDPRELF